jgi:hypothetical protein
MRSFGTSLPAVVSLAVEIPTAINFYLEDIPVEARV